MSHKQGSFLKGVSWGFIDNLTGTGINFVVGILLANKLAPEEFALVGLTLFMVAISNVLIDGGFSSALIRKTRIQEVEFHTIFWINVVCSLVVYSLLYALAPLFADFYALPDLREVTRVIGVIVILGSLSLIPKVRLTKALDFKSQAKASLSGSLLGASTALWLMYHDYGIWSIVVQQIVRQSIYTIVLWCQVRLFPRWQFSLQAAKELFAFGSRILLSALLDSIYNNAYYFIVGKAYSPRLLGLYTRAEQFSSTLAINFAMVLQRVSLPLFAEKKADALQFSQTFERQFRYSIFFSAIFALGTCAMAEHIVLTLVGAQWNDSIPLLRILCFSALLQPLIVLYQNVLQAYGKSQLFFNLEVAKKLFSIVVIAIGLYLGLSYLLWGIVIIAFVSLLINARYAQAHLPHYSLRRQSRDFLHSVAPLTILSVGVYGVGLFSLPHLWALCLQAGVLLLGVCFLFRWVFPTDFQRFRHRLLSFLPYAKLPHSS